MKQVKEMNRKELLDHMFALVSEVQHLYTMLQPQDTGHIHTTIGMLNSRIDDIKDCTVDNLTKIEGIEEDTAKELIERAEEFHQKDQMEINNKIRDLGLESELINHKGLTPGMLVTLGEQKILKLSDFADLSSDELTGAYDIVKGERVKIKGYLEDFALSKKEADDLIMSARDKIYKD